MTDVDPLKQSLAAEVAARIAADRPEPIELGRVRDFLQALDEPADIRDGDQVPALFLLTLARKRRPHAAGGPAAVKLGDEYEFTAPVYVGDVITSEGRLVSIDEKTTRLGPGYQVVTEWRFRNQHGEVVGVGRAKLLRTRQSS